MYCIDLESTDPFFNLAAEEYLLKKTSGEYLILYVNLPSVIIGKHQVAHKEADTEFITNNNIPVIRRISGGGAVYHDPGNLNFTFILKSSHGRQIDFRKYTSPVIEFLDSIGIMAIFEGKNDLKVNGLKISGNAEHVYHERVLHHGTLLFDADLTTLKASLRHDTSHYSTRAVSSNPSCVMNLKTACPQVNDTNEFKQLMLDYFRTREGNSNYEIDEGLIAEVCSLADSKFRSWEWNYAYGPEYHFNNSFKINGKPHECKLHIKNGIIWECEIDGSGAMSAVSKKLIGCRHMVEDMTALFTKEKVLISREDIIRFF